MANKYLILILSVLILLSAGAVSASDNLTFADDSDEVLEAENSEILTSGEGNFTELSTYLNGKTGEVSLNKSYKYVSGDSSPANGIVISKSLTINGNGNTIDASGLVRIFQVTSDNVVFNNITFINGYSSDNGGAISATGNRIIFNDCVFKNNKASQGGAIHTSGEIFRVDGCTFENNAATITADVNYKGGGAIFIDGDKSNILNSIFTKNNAQTALAGAIVVHGNLFNVSSCKFDSNTARKGGAIILHGDYANIELSSFTNNYIEFDAPDFGTDGPMGAGIYILGQHSIVDNCRFINNTMDKIRPQNHLGGGIYSYTQYVNITNCVFEDNFAGFGAGVYSHLDDMSIRNCNFTNNHVFDTGGAVAVKKQAEILDCNFQENIADTHGGALYIDEDGATKPATVVNCNFTLNHAKSNSGAIHIRTSNTYALVENCNFISNTAGNYAGAITANGNANITDCEFNGNNATYASAILFAERGSNKLYISNCVFGKNRANSASLTIDIDKKESYSPSNVTVRFELKGNDNIANAIHNQKTVNDIFISNITYEIYKDGALTTVTTPLGYVNPADGAENIDERNLWQDSRENAQTLSIQIICDETGESVLDENGEVLEAYQNLLKAQNTDELTDISGNITKLLQNLKAGNYTVYVSHQRDAYYTEIDQSDKFTVYDLNITKTTLDSEVYVGNTVTYNITIKNNGALDLTDVQVYENYPESFNLVSQSPDWINDGDLFIYPGTLPAWGSVTLTLTFNTTKTGKYNNTISVKTNEILTPIPASSNPTNVKPYPSEVKGKDVEVPEGSEISVPISSENATEIIYEIIDETGKVVKTGSLKPGENITGLKLPVGVYTLKLRTIVDENHTEAFNTSKIIVTPLDLPGNSTDDEPVLNETQEKTTNSTEVDSEKSKHSKAGLSMHKTANPIFALLAVLFALGLAQSRRFKK